MIVLEVNDRMETALHLAVSLGYFDMCEFLLEQDCGRVLLSALDMQKRTAADIAQVSKQQGAAILKLL